MVSGAALNCMELARCAVAAGLISPFRTGAALPLMVVTNALARYNLPGWRLDLPKLFVVAGTEGRAPNSLSEALLRQVFAVLVAFRNHEAG